MTRLPISLLQIDPLVAYTDKQSSAVPLLFSLLPPLSGSLPIQPSLHTPYFRIMLNLFFNPVSSLRGASPRTGAGSSQSAGQWNIVPAHQVQEDEGVLPADVVELVVDDFWAKYDDLRWAFFRETRYVYSAVRGFEHAGRSPRDPGLLLDHSMLYRRGIDPKRSSTLKQS